MYFDFKKSPRDDQAVSGLAREVDATGLSSCQLNEVGNSEQLHRVIQLRRYKIDVMEVGNVESMSQ
jgi:hypothetical protein